jgi:predicted nucleic acid-binding protein
VIAYLDSSVLLRVILGQPGALPEWSSIDRGVASAIVEVECLRTLDRLRLLQRIDDEAIALRRQAVFELVGALEVIEMGQTVLRRASSPMPTTLGTLDALHLASALLWRERTGLDVAMATHDRTLGTAARASGLRVIGV